MKQKLNLTELTNKELKQTNGGVSCVCKCWWHPDGSTNLDNVSMFNGL